MTLYIFPWWALLYTHHPTPKPYLNSFHRNLYEGVLMNINRDIHFNRRKIIGWKFYHNFIRKTFQIRICWMYKIIRKKKMFNYYFIILSFYFISSDTLFFIINIVSFTLFIYNEEKIIRISIKGEKKNIIKI